MHQSIPGVLMPHQAAAGHLPALSVPGVGALATFLPPGDWAVANPSATHKLLVCTCIPIQT